MSFLNEIEKRIKTEDSFQGIGKKPEGMKEKVIRYPGGVIREKYYGEEKEKKKNGVGGTLFGILFLLWFIGSIVFMITCFGSEEKMGLGAAVFGQMFVGFGIAALCAKALLGLLFVIIGGCVCAGGLLYHFRGASVQAFLVESAIPMAICSVFVLVGMGMFVVAYKNYYLKKKRCTFPVMAQSTYIDQEIVHVTKGSGDNKRTVPELMWVSYFQYYFNGNYYYADCDAIPVSRPQPTLGEQKEVLINPDNPEEYWSKSSSNFEMIILFAMGIVFTLAGGAALYFVTSGL